MKRVTITLEDYDDSKKLRAAIVPDEEATILERFLKKAGVDFSIDEASGPLFDFNDDQDGRDIDLPLRTADELVDWMPSVSS
jgi:hypothetical protein